MRVINLFAGPGAGKSTLAAALFAFMKQRGLNVELVTEYAKDMVYENRSNVLADQLYMLAKQNRRLQRLREHVDYVITDSPLLLCSHYTAPGYFDGFKPLVEEVWKTYDNVSVFIDRLPHAVYSEVGRLQNHAEAVGIDRQLIQMLVTARVPFMSFSADTPPETLYAAIDSIPQRSQNA